MEHKQLIDSLPEEFPTLKKIFRKHWETPLKEYSKPLFQIPPKQQETSFLKAFLEELLAMGIHPDVAGEATAQLRQLPVIQTSHHITPTNGPTFLALDLISLSGLPKEKIYLVGANSGVAFSNTAWSGALSFGELSLDEILQKDSSFYHQCKKSADERLAHGTSENRISLIPSKERDALVYGKEIGDYQTTLIKYFKEPARQLLNSMQPESSYSRWAAKICAGLERAIFNRSGIVYFDLNQVVRRYLLRVLPTMEEHPLYQLLFNQQTGEKIMEAFSYPTLFFRNYKGKKSQKLEGFIWDKEGFKGSKSGVQAISKEELIREIQNETLCPGIFLTFLILRFLNGIRCLGSFYQLEYLKEYRHKWEQLDLDWPLFLDREEEEMLTAGRLIKEEKALWPFDLYLHEKTLNIQEYASNKMGEFWLPIAQQLAVF